MNDQESAPAGWYPDGRGSRRYWDGSQWTDHVAPAASTAEAAKMTSAAKPWYRMWQWWVAIGAVSFCGLGLIGAVGGASDSGTTPDAAVSPVPDGPGEATEPPPAEAVKAGFSVERPVPKGTAVANKSAQYRILRVETSKTVGDSFINHRANGIYVLVTLSVKNVKGETIQITADDFDLIINGTEFESDSDAYLLLDKAFTYDDISPGLATTGTVVFDVPPSVAGKGVIRAQALFSLDEPVFLSLN